MKVLVPVKRVIDAYVKVRVRSDGSGVETANTKMAMNPFDEIAVEQAVRLQEAGIATETVAVTVGSAASHEQLRTAMAMGIERALHIEAEDGLEPLAVAKALSAVCEAEQPDLVLMGKQAIDDDCNQTGQMLAALRGCAQGTFVSRLDAEDGAFVITREVDGGLEKLRLLLPAVVTVDLRLNEPRYPKLPNIMKAKKKPIEAQAIADLGVDGARRLNILRVDEPPVRQGGSKVADVAELVDKLTNELKVV